MNTILASEIKQRGIAIVDEALQRGPVHVIHHGMQRYVILSEDEYQRLASHKGEDRAVWDFLEDRPRQGTRTKQDIDNQIAKERASWK